MPLFLSFFLLQVTNCERQIMKPLYDRYRLVKQILCRASTIPVIVSIASLTSHLLLFSLHSCPLVLLLFDNRTAKITTLSKRLQRLNPQLPPALVPAVGTGGSRATDVLSTFQGSKSGFSSSVNPPVVKELIGGRLSSQEMTS